MYAEEHVRLDAAVYERLNARRREGETLSEAVERLLDETRTGRYDDGRPDDEAMMLREVATEERGRWREKLRTDRSGVEADLSDPGAGVREIEAETADES